MHENSDNLPPFCEAKGGQITEVIASSCEAELRRNVCVPKRELGNEKRKHLPPLTKGRVGVGFNLHFAYEKIIWLTPQIEKRVESNLRDNIPAVIY